MLIYILNEYWGLFSPHTTNLRLETLLQSIWSANNVEHRISENMQNKISESEDEFEMSRIQFSEIILRKIAQEID